MTAEINSLSDLFDKVPKEISTFTVEKVVTNRRGAIVAKVSDGKTLRAIKVSRPDAENLYEEEEVIIREARILWDLGHIADDLYITHSESSPSWLLSRWLTGETASDKAKQLREAGDFRKIIKLMIMVTSKVNVIHQAGYVHGDLQPAHFILEDKNCVLIDWALARRNDDASFKFKGAFVHYASPEVAKGMLSENDNIEHDRLSEVYSLTAVLFFMFTGKTSTFYGSYDYRSIPLADKLKAVTEGNLHTFEQLGIEEFKNVESVLLKGLRLDRTQRYQSVEELLQALKKCE